jgi:cell division protein FtsX
MSITSSTISPSSHSTEKLSTNSLDAVVSVSLEQSHDKQQVSEITQADIKRDVEATYTKDVLKAFDEMVTEVK